MLKIFLICTFLTIFVTCQIPSFIHICPLNDNQCYLLAAQQGFQYLIRGNPALNIPPLFPFHFSHATIELSPNFNLTFDGAANVTDDINVNNINIDLAKHIFEVDLNVSRVLVNGNFTLDGQILNIPITGTGFFSVLYQSVDLMYIGLLDTVTIDNIVYYQLKKSMFTFDYKLADTGIDGLNLLGINPSDAIYGLVGQDLNNLSGSLRNYFNVVGAQVGMDYINSILRLIPADQLFLNPVSLK